MKPLEQLPMIADKTLGGLRADSEMRCNIQLKAIEREKKQKRYVLYSRLAAVACCAVLLIALIGFPQESSPVFSAPNITSLPLGDGSPLSAADPVLKSEITVSGRSRQQSSGIWAEPVNGSYPLLGIKGAYYRLLTTPESADDAWLGDQIASVDVFSSEPSLTDASVVCSNCVYAGKGIRPVKNMGGTFVSAEIDGTQRLFQRVSFNGRATVSHESFADTLQIGSHILSITYPGHGTIVDSQVCEELFSLLSKEASFESTSTLNTEDTVIFTLDNGISAQVLIRDDKISACGVWSCPEFVSALEAKLP